MLFREDMTYPEALKTFFKAAEGKTKAEIAQIQEEFKKIIPSLVDREIDGSPQLTSYKI
ncbi:MAG: hypothetical protein IJV14_02935 [Lachnospiraceae bacterium]|nr:hypothetical protein [Lachnospiraceae bacterium]